MSKKLKIGIDIDEVVVEFFKKYLELFNKKFDQSISFEDLTSYHIWDICNISKEDSLKLVEEFQESEHFDKMDLVEGFKDSLVKLNGNYEIHFITSRSEGIREKTNNFLRSLFEGFNFNLHFSGGVWNNYKSKGEICKELRVDYFIEDNPDYALDCAKKGIKTFLLDKPWNKNYKKHENIIKVQNWKEILEKINCLGGNEHPKIF